jgi:CTP-dependent riboflavin kinase
MDSMREGRKIVIGGKITSGVSRGKPLIDLFYYQMKNVLGFEIFEGTLNVKVKKPVNLAEFATKTVDRILLDGTRHINLYIAPVTLVVLKQEDYIELEDAPNFKKKGLRDQIEELKKHQAHLIREEQKTDDLLHYEAEKHDCFAIQEKDVIDMTVIELVDVVNIREKLGLDDGNTVDIVFYERQPLKRRHS